MKPRPCQAGVSWGERPGVSNPPLTVAGLVSFCTHSEGSWQVSVPAVPMHKYPQLSPLPCPAPLAASGQAAGLVPRGLSAQHSRV